MIQDGIKNLEDVARGTVHITLPCFELVEFVIKLDFLTKFICGGFYEEMFQEMVMFFSFITQKFLQGFVPV